LLFKTGRIRWTKAVLTHDDITTHDLAVAFERYIRGDWGDLEDAEKLQNDLAITNGDPICAVYTSKRGVRFCITTAAGRTTVSLPEEATDICPNVRRPAPAGNDSAKFVGEDSERPRSHSMQSNLSTTDPSNDS
jgi:hypothetical protein